MYPVQENWIKEIKKIENKNQIWPHDLILGWKVKYSGFNKQRYKVINGTFQKTIWANTEGNNVKKFCGRRPLSREDAIRPAMRHSRSRRHRHSQLPVKIRAPTPNVNAGAECCSIKSSSAWFSHQIPAALIWSATLSGRARDSQTVKSQSLALGSKTAGRKSRNSWVKRWFLWTFHQCQNHLHRQWFDLTGGNVNNKRLQQNANAWQVHWSVMLYVLKEQLARLNRCGDLKQVVLCEIPCEEAWLKKTFFTFYKTGQLDAISLSDIVTDGQKSVDTLRLQSRRKRNQEAVGRRSSHVIGWSQKQPSTSFWNKYDTNPSVRLEKKHHKW